MANLTFLRKGEEKFFYYFRMSSSLFDELVAVAVVRDHDCGKQKTRQSVPAEERLSVTLWYVSLPTPI